MTRAHSRRQLIGSLLAGGVALQAAPLWASEAEEASYAEAWWEAYLAGKQGVVRHPDRAAEAALQAIAAPLCRVSTRRNLEWRVGLLKVDPRNVNAFAVGSGVFFVHDALLSWCTSETDLAAVIGHEIGHIEHRHIIKRMFATQFLQRHVNDTPWAHLDIAGTGMGSPNSEINRSWGSGWGVRLLDQLVSDHYER